MKIGLCLSGGGIKGAAHIGAIKAFEEENLYFDYVAGTSAGSIVASLYAYGYSSKEMFMLFKKYGKSVKYIDWENVFKIIWNVIFRRRLEIKGLKTGKVIEKIINKSCNNKNIKDFTRPLLIPTIDSDSGKVLVFNSCNIDEEDAYEKYISSVNIGKAVRASCSYPLVFEPCKYKNTELLDGGIKENIPWKELKRVGCGKIVSIGFKNKKKKRCCNNVIEIAERSFELMCDELNRHEIDEIDFLHNIRLDDVSLLDIEKMDEIFNQGYLQTKEKIKDIKSYLQI